MTLPAPLNSQGRIGRAKYGLTVIFATLIFNNILRVLALSVGTSMPSGLSYLLPIGMFLSPSGRFWQALPFFAFVSAIYLGLVIAMTWRRLRDLETTEWYVLLLFVPVLNVLFFILLCLQPDSESLDKAEGQNRPFFETLIPSSTAGSAVVGALTGAITAAVLSWFAVIVLGHYGSVLFLGLPVFIGYFAAWIHSYRQPRSLGECCVAGLSSIVVSAALIVGIAFEGIICVAMAMPLALPLGILGGYLAYVTQRSKVLQPQPAAMMSLLLTLPLLMGAEYLKPEAVPQHVVHSSVIIDAPSRIVWKRIVDLPRIEEKPHWILRLGMAYPMETRTSGSGLTAERLTTFSTGLSREPLVAWEAGKHLAFRVADEPPLMKETSPYGTINVRHLEDHDFRPGRVDFYLTEIPGGHTRVDCFSSYQNRMWPGEYWQLWTDEIVRQIQWRVFRQIKRTAETEGPR